MRTIYDLLPQLLQSPTGGRVINVLAAGKEAAINTSDLDLQHNYTFPNSATHGATMNSLALEELASQNPRLSFIHAYPGLVQTDLIGKLLKGASGWKGYVTNVVSWTLYPILRLISMSEKESGERFLYEATSANFAVGAEGSELNAFYRVDWTQDRAPQVAQLDKYREEGMPKKVWEHTMSIFEKVLN